MTASHSFFSSSFGFFVLEVSLTSQRERLAVAAVLLLGNVCVKGLPKLEPYSAGLYSGRNTSKSDRALRGLRRFFLTISVFSA